MPLPHPLPDPIVELIARRFRVIGEPMRIRILDRLRGPANHDGGGLEIGTDGFLYVSVGDTGCNSGQPAEPPYTPRGCIAQAWSLAEVLRCWIKTAEPSSQERAQA